MLAVATLALTLAGGLPVYLAALFLLLMVAAWKFEGHKWQLTERVGLIVVLLSIPLFLLDWKYQNVIGEPSARVGVSALAHLIIFLAAVKLLQAKKDRDWVFLYLISFFEVLLAAGLSFSPIFLGSLSLYLLCGLSTIIAFEIQRSKRTIAATETHLLVSPDSRIFKNHARRSPRNAEVYRLPVVAFLLLLLIFALALPLFLVAPRSGAATFARSGGGLTNFVGFSENVRLGEIGDLKHDNAVVMRVRIEEKQPDHFWRWRGIALDEFTGRAWRKSPAARVLEPLTSDRGFFQLGTTEALQRLATQTIFLEPIDSPVIFAASRPVAIQGDFSSVILDVDGGIRAGRREFGRAMYKALSDITEPDVALLRSDRRSYPEAFERYLQLPRSLDSRVAILATSIIVNAKANNRYDAAKAIESHLQQDYGYSLQMRASGSDPLADFLFNVKAGHCEYFSTAMAVMLRTHGIAARVVNGFLPGEFNEAAGAFTVRQSDAHSWVEVYFPETRSWVTFDPTPLAGRIEPVRAGLTGQLEKYAEALELMWFQYVVGYDKQEQRSLATAVSNRLLDSRRYFTQALSVVRAAASSRSGTLVLFGSAAGVLILLTFGARRIRSFGWRRALQVSRPTREIDRPAVEFYERLIALLARQGIERNPDLTPLEFAATLGLQPVLSVTRAYNRVRFGGQQLSAAEVRDIESTLEQLENQAEARP